MKLLKNAIMGFVFTFVALGTFVGLTSDSQAQSACSGEIVKLANPADDTPFTFIVSDGEGNEEVTLRDPSDNVFPISLGPGGTLLISEELPQGWALESIECIVDGPIDFKISLEDNLVIIDCLDSIGLIQCEFNNVLAPVELAQVPTLSEWGLVSMASILGIVGFMVAKRRKLAA